MIKIHGDFAMRYLIFSLTALFLTACADPDNPVVYTAPAGKAAVDEDEVKQPPGTNFGSYEEVPYVPVDPPETAAHTKADDPNTSNVDESIHTQSEIDAHRTDPLPPANNGCTVTYQDDEGNTVTERVDCRWKETWDTGDPTLRESIRNRYRYEQLVEDGVLPTVSVSGCKRTTDEGTYAIFTFTRTGPTTENLSFTFNWGGEAEKTITTGFGAGNATTEWNGGSLPVGVSIAPGWNNDTMTSDFELGTSSALVDNSSSACP